MKSSESRVSSVEMPQLAREDGRGAVGDVERHVFFAQTSGTDRARVVSTMTWVEHDAFHDPRSGSPRGFDRLRHRFGGDVDYETERLGQVEHLAIRGLSEVEHHAHPLAPLAQAHTLDQSADAELQRTFVARGVDVDVEARTARSRLRRDEAHVEHGGVSHEDHDSRGVLRAVALDAGDAHRAGRLPGPDGRYHDGAVGVRGSVGAGRRRGVAGSPIHVSFSLDLAQHVGQRPECGERREHVLGPLATAGRLCLHFRAIHAPVHLGRIGAQLTFEERAIDARRARFIPVLRAEATQELEGFQGVRLFAFEPPESAPELRGAQRERRSFFALATRTCERQRIRACHDLCPTAKRASFGRRRLLGGRRGAW